MKHSKHPNSKNYSRIIKHAANTIIFQFQTQFYMQRIKTRSMQDSQQRCKTYSVLKQAKQNVKQNAAVHYQCSTTVKIGHQKQDTTTENFVLIICVIIFVNKICIS